MVFYADDNGNFVFGEREGHFRYGEVTKKIRKWTNSNRKLLNIQKCRSLIRGNFDDHNSTENIVIEKVSIKM